MKRRTGWLIVLLGVGDAGCTSEDGLADADPGPRIVPGQARAWRLESVDELPDPEGDFTGAQAGDLALVNDHVVAVVRAQVGGLTVPGFHGGGLVDLYARGGRDTLREHIVIVGFREVKPTSFDVVADGSAEGEGVAGAGAVAVVRVDGEDTDIHIIPDDFPISSGDSLGARITTEYRLGPDDRFVTLVTTVDRPGAALESLNAGDGMYISDDGVPFLPGAERNAGGLPVGQAPYVVQGGIAMVSEPPNPSGLALSIDNISGLLPANVQVSDGRPGSFARRFYVGDPDAPPAHTAGLVEAYMGTELGSLRVDGLPAEALVEVRRSNGKLAAVGDGATPFPVPAGELTATVILDERLGVETPITVTAGAETTASPPAPGFGTLALSATDDSGVPLPARALIFPPDSPRMVALIPPAGMELLVPPGELRVVVSRGFEYEIHDERVTVQESRSASVSAVLAHVVDTPGAVSTDTHIHSIWSTDSKVPEPRRVLSIAAEGVEMPVATDHDMVTQYRVPDDLQAWVRPIVGVETSTSNFGHYNGYPLQDAYDRTAPRNGAPDWLGLQPAEVFANMRATGAPIVQINHPIGDTGKDYFSAVGLTPDPATSLPPADMALGFDVIEIYNRGEDGQVDEVLAATHKILNTGKRVGFVGVSDSHTVDRWVGHPRTYLPTPTGPGAPSPDDPGSMTPDDFAQGILTRTTVVGGPYIEASITSPAPGAPPEGSVSIALRIQAPSWVPVDSVTVVTSEGVAAERTDMAEGVVRFEDTITIDRPPPLPANAGPAWLYIRVDSARRMDPVMGGRVFSATSPYALQ